MESVKGGTMDAYPGSTLEEAFDDFFEDGFWTYKEYDFETSCSVIVFSGRCLYQDEEVMAHITLFSNSKSNRSSFEYLYFDDQLQSEEMLSLLLQTVFASNENV